MAKQTSEAGTERKGGLIPWSPFGEMARWGDMERMLGNFLTGRAHPLFEERWWPGSSLEMREPALDVYEEKDQIVVAELPGLRDDVESHSDNVQSREKEEGDRKGLPVGQVYGAFFRAVPHRGINPEDTCHI
jgi:HSP20 family molecular chaperone IbpA